MNFLSKTILTGAVMSGGVLGALPFASSTSAPLNTYEHGLYAQGHWSSQSSCNDARSKAITSMENYGATAINAGDCHQINATEGGVTKTGWVFDATYKRSLAVWYKDVNLGQKATVNSAQHSFKFTGSYANKSDAVRYEADRNKTISATPGAKVTWRSGVTQDAKTKNWVYEINYNSRTPIYWAHLEISENANVTTPSIKVATTPVVVVPNPTGGKVTTPTTTTNPGTGTVINKGSDEAIGVQGLDISGHTIVNDWQAWKNAGVKYVYIKATESNSYKNSAFSTQYTGATNNGILRGAYHFANPEFGSGSDQANFFVNNGGGWSNDGQTLPGALDMEWNPYGQSCYNKTPAQLQTYVTDFVNTYKARTGAYPIIYTANAWWNQCVGGNFTTPAPLWMASYSSTPGRVPATWPNGQLIWQNSAVDAKGYDTDVFNGTLTQLKNYALTGVSPK